MRSGGEWHWGQRGGKLYGCLSLPGHNSLAVDLDKVLRADDGEWHQTTKLCVLLDSIFVVLLDVVGEVVARNE